MSPDAVLGAILAGGRNTRYGALKALETVAGRRIIDRVIDALQQATPNLILITNDPTAYASIDLPKRGDEWPDVGALAGIQAALLEARDQKCAGVMAVACDMPFVSPALLQAMVARADTADVVVPESSSRRGVEPLCAFYGVGCLPALERALARHDHRMISFHDEVAVQRVPIEEVRAFGDPDVLFMNVNTREERARAEQFASRHERNAQR